MKTRVFLSVVAFSLTLNVFSQNSTLELTFTAIHDVSYAQLDSIKVINYTQGGDTILYWPDTVLVLDYTVGIPEVKNEKRFEVFQNFPNPVEEQTTISIYVPNKDKVGLFISDILGRQIISTEMVLEKGYHSFRFTPGSGEVYFCTVISKEGRSSIKILNAANNPSQSSSIKYLESNYTASQFKSINKIQGFEFNPGDELLYIGYKNSEQSGFLDFPESNKTYTFQFAAGIPCPDAPTITYEGQVYNTVQIGSQCWFKENLNVGLKIPSFNYQWDNGLIEKYCYNDNETYCETYGGLYQWNEMMQYDTIVGIQGICPDGWHIPSDNEWKILEGFIDGEYGIGSQQWDTVGFRGSDVGTKIKATCGWINWSGSDDFNFSMFGTGIWHCSGYYEKYGENGRFWTSNASTEYNAWGRSMYYNHNNIYRNKNGNRNSGFSVRCLKDISDE